MADTTIDSEIKRRRTFAIISHPDAGKTTLTEKFLLYGGAVQSAGAVKARKAQRSATSDWMEMEKERGISVSSTILSFDYKGYRLNLLDTPGHQDFSEDTFRTLLAVDAAIMILDGARGIQEQTLKLFQVCKKRGIPIFTFINKMDRPALDPFELMEEIENTLGITPIPVNWPLGSGDRFQGVCNIKEQQVYLYERSAHGTKKSQLKTLPAQREALEGLTDDDVLNEFFDGLELLEAVEPFDQELFLAGKQSPMYFGSALSNFGIELFLDDFLVAAPTPKARETIEGEAFPPNSEDFTAFVFKIQANMNPKHRDRVIFLRICSGEFTRDLKVTCSRTQKEVRVNHAQQLFGQERTTLEEAYAGDVMGLVYSGDLILGDTLSSGKPIQYEPVPQFSPEFFTKLLLKDPSKRKQFLKALDQLCREGAIQVFFDANSATRDPILGAVGQLQFDVVENRLEHDYRIQVTFESMPYRYARWVDGSDEDLSNWSASRNALLAEDLWERPVVLCPSEWDLNYAQEKNPNLTFSNLSVIGDY